MRIASCDLLPLCLADALDETAVKSLIAATLEQREARTEQQTNSDIEQLHLRLSNEADALSARIADLVRLGACKLIRSSGTMRMPVKADCEGKTGIGLAEYQSFT